MRIVAISDTHGLQRHIQQPLPDGDVLIHAGDLTSEGTLQQCAIALNWLGEVAKQYRHGVVCVAGNHDFLAERDPALWESLIPEGVTYLCDSGITLEGVHFWGSPVQPRFHNWAFNHTSAQLERHWQQIPDGTDVLLLHGPPYGILDITQQGDHVGDVHLFTHVQRVSPRLVVFGHIHEAHGVVEKNGTTFANASLVNRRYSVVNRATVVDL